MAKPPETSKRFRIWGETTVQQLGFVVEALTELGLTHIGHELITDVLVYKQRKPRVPKEAAEPKKKRRKRGSNKLPYKVGNREFLLQCFKGRDEITAAEANAMFEKDGRSAKSAGSLLSQLGQKKIVKGLGDGRWKIMAKGQQMLNGTGAEAVHG